MRARGLTTGLVAGVVLAAGGFALASCGGGDESSETTTGINETTTTATTTESETETAPPVPSPTVVRITVVDGSPKGGIVRESVTQGDRVAIVVTSDVADEVHLHGYDVRRNVAAGGTVRLPFRATIPGRFEVELEDRGVQLADITVNP